MEDYEHALIRYCRDAGGMANGPASRIAPCLASVRAASQCCLSLAADAADDTGPVLSGVCEILEAAAEELREAERVIEIDHEMGSFLTRKTINL